MSALPPCPSANPGDDDLTGVVTHLTTLTTRRGAVARDPNEPEVRWLLEAGIRALGEAVLDTSSNSSGPVAYSHANSLFDTLPIERVMRCFRDMCVESGIDPGSANKARLIRRWSFAANYQLDLIAYLFRPEVHIRRLDAATERLAQILPDLTLRELVDAISEQESTLTPIATVYRLQHVMRMMFPADDVIRQYSARLYDLQISHWADAYRTVAIAYDLPLHSAGATFTDLATVLGLAVEGAFVRSTGLPRHAICTDGTPAVVAAVRSITAAAAGAPWAELADRRADLSRLTSPEALEAIPPS